MMEICEATRKDSSRWVRLAIVQGRLAGSLGLARKAFTIFIIYLSTYFITSEELEWMPSEGGDLDPREMPAYMHQEVLRSI
jgi:hypothetical protein